MPSKSEAQEKFMKAVAASGKFAKKVGVPQSVGQEFASADEAKKPQSAKEMREKRYGKE